MAPRADVARTQQKILTWFDAHGRSFPWRQHRDPYKTLVAEVMLQQTQTGRVAPSYSSFVERFPTVESLARAPAMDVIAAWRGLGYNRRAVDLQRAARAIVHDHGGDVPADVRTLRALPGVGEYSASAVACFAFDEQVPVIDVNVRRVLARATLGTHDAPKEKVAQTASRWLPHGDAYRWNQALMDIGAMFCRSTTPLCSKCPLRSACAYVAKGRHLARPAAPPKERERFEGSRRQKRGNIVDHLRDAASAGITLGALARALHPDQPPADLSWLVELLQGLERDGLVTMSASAHRGSPRGTVRLPR